MWCAGEIATAVANDVRVVLVACDDYVPLSEDDLENLGQVWTKQQMHTLNSYGLPLEAVRAAYEILRGGSLAQISFPRFGSSKDQARAIVRVVEECKLPWRAGRYYCPPIIGKSPRSSARGHRAALPSRTLQ